MVDGRRGNGRACYKTAENVRRAASGAWSLLPGVWRRETAIILLKHAALKLLVCAIS